MDATAVRIEARGAVERCPYCHDLPGDGALVLCPGCGTAHHAECVAELGRCTALGCERPLAAPDEVPTARSRTLRAEVRRRVQAKARAFTARHCALAPVATAATASDLGEAVLEVVRAEASERWADLARALLRVLELELLLGGGADRDELAAWIGLDEVRRRLVEAERRATTARRLQLPRALALAFILLNVATLAGVALLSWLGVLR